MFSILVQILPLFSIIAIGWLITHFKLANETWNKPIADFALYIGFPALILAGMISAPISNEMINKSFFSNSIYQVSLVITLIILFRFIKIESTNKATFIICFMFGNIAFLGIPLISSLDPSLQQEATLNTAVHLFWVFTLGIFMVEYYTAENPNLLIIIKNLSKNPLLLAVILGAMINVLTLNIPHVIIKPIDMLGKAVSPMVMLMIGIFIRSNTMNKSEMIKSIGFSILKLLIIPLLVILFISLKTAPKNYYTTITDIAMPVAITPFALASYYNLNKMFITNVIIFSTIISIISIPLILYLIKLF